MTGWRNDLVLLAQIFLRKKRSSIITVTKQKYEGRYLFGNYSIMCICLVGIS